MPLNNNATPILTSTAAYASRPAAGTAGNLFLPSDGYTVQRDTGAAWVPWGPVLPLTQPPAVASWTWRNQGSATATDDAGAVVLKTITAGINLRILELSAPTPPYTRTASMLFTGDTNGQCGLCWTDGTKVVGFIFSIVGGVPTLGVYKYTNVTTFSATYTTASVPLMVGGPVLLQISDDNTNRLCRISGDKKNWYEVHSVARTDFLTPTTIGWLVDGGTSSVKPAVATLVSWE